MEEMRCITKILLKKLLKNNYACWAWGVKNIVEKEAYFFIMLILFLIFIV